MTNEQLIQEMQNYQEDEESGEEEEKEVTAVSALEVCVGANHPPLQFGSGITPMFLPSIWSILYSIFRCHKLSPTFEGEHR